MSQHGRSSSALALRLREQSGGPVVRLSGGGSGRGVERGGEERRLTQPFPFCGCDTQISRQNRSAGRTDQPAERDVLYG